MHQLKSFMHMDSRGELTSYAEAHEFFRKHCASIEVYTPDISHDIVKKRLQRFYFPKPPVCQFLTSAMRDSCMTDINRDTPAEKIQDLFRRSDAVSTISFC